MKARHSPLMERTLDYFGNPLTPEQIERNRRRIHRLHVRAAVRRAVSSGALVRPEKCSRCGSGGRIQAHHHDYDKPLDVEWLCASCHLERHGSF